MTIDRIPSFWDQLGGGLANYSQSVTDAQRYKDEQAQRNLQTQLSLYQSGNLDSSNLNGNPLLEKLGIKSLQPTQQEARRKITADDNAGSLDMNGVAGLLGTPKIPLAPQHSDDERRYAGMMTSGDKSKEAFTQLQQQVESKRLGHLQRFMSGEQLTEPEAEVAGVKTPAQREADRLKLIDPIIEQRAGNYVDGLIAAHGGRIDNKSIHDIAENSFQKYKTDRAQTRMGNLTPEDEAYARSFFNTAAMNRLREQRHQDMTLQAALGRQPSKEDQLLDRIIKIHQARRQELEDFEKAVPYAGTIDVSKPNVSPAMKAQVEHLMQLRKAVHDMSQAEGQIVMGITPKNLAGILTDGEKPAEEAVAKPSGGAVVQPVIKPTVVDKTKEELDTGIQYMKGLQPADREKFVTSALEQGKITKTDANRLRSRFGMSSI